MENSFILQSLMSKKECDNIEEVYDLTKKLNNLFKTKEITEKILELEKIISKKYKVYDELLEKRAEQLRNTLGKYWEITCYYNNGIINTDIIFPYRLLEDNCTYWFVRGNLTRFNSGMESTRFDYESVWVDGVTAKFKEITKDEFMKRVHDNYDAPLTYRLNNLE